MSARPPLHVMHLLTSYSVGGAECVALNLAAAMHGERFRCSVCALDGDGPMRERFREKGIATLDAPLRPGLRRGIDLLRLARLLRRERVEVLHCHNVLPLIYGAAAATLARVPAAVCTRHSMPTGTGRGRQILLERAAGALLDCEIAISDGVLLAGIAARRMPQRKSVVIYNAIDVERFRPADARPQRDRVVIGCVARLSEEKRHVDLVEAVGELARRRIAVELRLIGDGAMRGAIEEQVRAQGLESRVCLLGTRVDIPELLRELDIFALPSRTEGLPLSVLEAMASGLPVVATDVGSLSEIISHGRNGLLVPPRCPKKMAEALESLALDAAMRQNMGREGRRIAEQDFSLSAAARHHAELYERLIAG